MKGNILIIFFLVLSLPCTSFALSDSEYEILKENSQEFADADKQLGETWRTVKSRLNEAEAKTLLQNQRAWIKSGRDEEAAKFIKEQNLSRTKAYTQAIKERIKFLNEYSPAAVPAQSMANKNLGNESNTVTVEAEGTGSSKKEALQAAWMEAVRQGVGMFMVGKTNSINDELTEKIVTHSRGQVNAYKIIDESNDGGKWKITIIANINKELIKETVASSQSKKLEFDGASVSAQNITKDEKKLSLSETLSELADVFNFPSILSYEAKILKDKNNFYLQHTLKIDLKKYQEQVKQLEPSISKLAKQKIDVHLKINSAKEEINLLKNNNYKLEYIGKNYLINLPKKYNDVAYPFQFEKNEILKNAICFMKNVGQASCYDFDRNLNFNFNENFIKKYKLTFIAESGQDIDSIISQHSFTIVYPPIAQQYGKPPYYCPAFTVINNTNRDGSLLYPNALVINFIQYLDLSNDQLLDIKEITGKYTLEELKKRIIK